MSKSTSKNIGDAPLYIIALIVAIVAYLLWKNFYSQEHLTLTDQIKNIFKNYIPKEERKPKGEYESREEDNE